MHLCKHLTEVYNNEIKVENVLKTEIINQRIRELNKKRKKRKIKEQNSEDYEHLDLINDYIAKAIVTDTNGVLRNLKAGFIRTHGKILASEFAWRTDEVELCKEELKNAINGDENVIFLKWRIRKYTEECKNLLFIRKKIVIN